jgi:signal transduction histidine kinase
MFFNEELFRNLLANFPGGVVGVFNRELELVSVGGGMLWDLGIQPFRLEGRMLQELPDPGTRRILLHHCSRALENTQQRFSITYAGRNLEITATPVQQDGMVTGCLVIAHNVTHHISQYQSLQEQHKNSQYTIREYERLLHSTFQAIEDTLLVVDREHAVVMSNEGDASSSLKATCYGYFMRRDAACPRCPLTRVFEQGEHVTTELEVKKDEIYKHIRIHPIYDENGEVELAVVHIRDISKQKRDEKNLRALTESLEEKVRERTREHERTIYQLENEIELRKKEETKRRQLLRELSTANKELESFSYTVSHDLRAPLRNIKGYSRVLLEDCGTEVNGECGEYLRRIEAGSEKMEQLIDAILTLSRIDRRQMSYEEVNLSTLFRDSLSGLREAEPERRVRVFIETGLTVWGDRRLLALVARNLVENAWKYSSRVEEAEIRFGLIRREGKRIYYLADNGAGFDTALSQQLFQPFRRLHTETEFPGMGVGLATVRRIILRHGGQIWAVGREGRGATFYFTIFPGTGGGETDESSD